jgi:hypothetical protein
MFSKAPPAGLFAFPPSLKVGDKKRIARYTLSKAGE